MRNKISKTRDSKTAPGRSDGPSTSGFVFFQNTLDVLRGVYYRFDQFTKLREAVGNGLEKWVSTSREKLRTKKRTNVKDANMQVFVHFVILCFFFFFFAWRTRPSKVAFFTIFAPKGRFTDQPRFGSRLGVLGSSAQSILTRHSKRESKQKATTKIRSLFSWNGLEDSVPAWPFG